MKHKTTGFLLMGSSNILVSLLLIKNNEVNLHFLSGLLFVFGLFGFGSAGSIYWKLKKENRKS